MIAWTGFLLWATWPALEAHVAAFEKSYPSLAGKLVLALLAALALYLVWIRKFVWRHEPQLVALASLAPIAAFAPRAAVVVGLICAAAFALGSLTASRLSLELPRGAASLSMATILGLALICILLFALGLLQLYDARVLWPLLAAGAFLGRRRIWSAREDFIRIGLDWKRCRPLSQAWAGICVFFGMCVAASLLAVVLAPTTAFDAIHFHLPLIRSYSIAGGLIEIPQLLGNYAYNPQNFEILLAAAHVLGGEAAAQLITVAFPVLAVLVAVAISRLAGFSRASIVLGLAAAASMPMLVWCAGSIKNDFAMACFQLAAIYASLQSARNKALGWLLVSGLLMGSAFGVKPTALFAALPVGLFWIYDCARREDRFRSLVLTGLCFACSAFLWPARSYILTGQPFGSAAPAAALAALNVAGERAPANDPARYLRTAIDAHINGNRGVFELPIKSPVGVTASALVGGAFFSFLWLRRRRNKFADRVGLIVLLSLFYWSSTMRTSRYAITPILLTPFIVAPAFLKSAALLGQNLRLLLAGALVYSFLFSLLPTLYISNGRAQLMNVAGKISDDDFINGYFRSHRAIQALHGRVTAEDEVLLVDGCAVGYAPYPWKVTCCSGPTQPCPLSRVRSLAQGPFRFVVLPKKMDPAVLGEGWLLVAAPEDSSAAVYESPRRTPARRKE